MHLLVLGHHITTPARGRANHRAGQCDLAYTCPGPLQGRRPGGGPRPFIAGVAHSPSRSGGATCPQSSVPPGAPLCYYERAVWPLASTQERRLAWANAGPTFAAWQPRLVPDPVGLPGGKSQAALLVPTCYDVCRHHKRPRPVRVEPGATMVTEVRLGRLVAPRCGTRARNPRQVLPLSALALIIDIPSPVSTGATHHHLLLSHRASPFFAHSARLSENTGPPDCSEVLSIGRAAVACPRAARERLVCAST